MIFLIAILTVWIFLALLAIGLSLAAHAGDLPHAKPVRARRNRQAHYPRAGRYLRRL
jgi:hypothetical protein